MALLIPIVVEQLLNSLMGMVDTMMVSNVGSEAISAVSLVDSMNNLVIQIFSAMAAGASIICSQYLGGRDREGCNRAARQVVLTVLVISVGVMFLGLCLRRPLLRLVFGRIEPGLWPMRRSIFCCLWCPIPFWLCLTREPPFFGREAIPVSQ